MLVSWRARLGWESKETSNRQQLSLLGPGTVGLRRPGLPLRAQDLHRTVPVQRPLAPSRAGPPWGACRPIRRERRPHPPSPASRLERTPRLRPPGRPRIPRVPNLRNAPWTNRSPSGASRAARKHPRGWSGSAFGPNLARWRAARSSDSTSWPALLASAPHPIRPTGSLSWGGSGAPSPKPGAPAGTGATRAGSCRRTRRRRGRAS